MPNIRCVRVGHPATTRCSLGLADRRGAWPPRAPGLLAFTGSHKVNGVSALHTGLMRRTVFRDFNTLFPDRITNKTNGISFRRWLFQCNPGLTALLAEALGPRVMDDAAVLAELRPFAEDPLFRGRYAAVSAPTRRRCGDDPGTAGVKVDRRDVRLRSSASTNTSGIAERLQTVALYEAIRAPRCRPGRRR